LLLLLGVLPLWLLLVDVVCATLQAKIGEPVWVQVLQHYLYNRDHELANMQLQHWRNYSLSCSSIRYVAWLRCPWDAMHEGRQALLQVVELLGTRWGGGVDGHAGIAAPWLQ
jgi:hypothetical protein